MYRGRRRGGVEKETLDHAHSYTITLVLKPQILSLGDIEFEPVCETQSGGLLALCEKKNEVYLTAEAVRRASLNGAAGY